MRFGFRIGRARRWTVWLGGAAILVAAAVGYFSWRPMTVLDGVARARLWAAGARGGYVPVGDYRIHYVVAGAGRPVLLLHGLGSNAESFGDYITVLAKDGRVLAPDLLGFGRSSQPDVDYSIPLQAETVRGFLDSLGIPQADIVGMSMGGAVAAEFARRYPERVRRLVLLAAGGLMQKPGWAMPFVPRSARDVPKLMQLLGPRTPPRLPGFVRRDLVRAFQPYGRVVEQFVRRRAAGMDLLDGKLAPIDVPVLLVWGSRDLLSPLEQGEAFHRQLPQSELLVLKGCGHLAMTDCKSAVQPAVRSFLAAAEPPRGGRREVAVE